MNIPIKRFDKAYPLPFAKAGAACFDFICRETVTIPARSIKPVAQNAAIKVPDGHAMLLFVRSSTPLRKSLMLANSVGVVDPFFCGNEDENLAFLYNFTDEPVTVEAGDPVVQGMIMKSEPVTWDEVETMPEAGYGGYQHMDELK